MAIIYDDKNREFYLHTQHFSYIFYLNQYGVPVHLYFGKKCLAFDRNSVIKHDIWTDYAYLENGKETQIPGDGFIPEKNLYEASPYNRVSHRESLAIIEKKNGSRVTDFRFLSYEVSLGKKPLEGFPSPLGDADSETLSLVLRDPDSGALLILDYILYPSRDILIRRSSVQNDSTDVLTVKRLFSSEVSFYDADYDLISFGGGYGKEFGVERKPLGRGLRRLASSEGLSSHQINPTCVLAKTGANETKGFCLGLALVYSGDFAIEAYQDEWGQTILSAGVNDEDFDYRLTPGETLNAPEVVLIPSLRGFADLSARSQAFVRANLVKKEQRSLSQEILLNSWEAYYMNFDTAKVLAAIKQAHEWDITLFVLDDGWFGERNDDHRSLGDWQVNEKKIDLHKVIDAAHALGMKFGLWFEPEMISPLSQLYQAHPDWAEVDPSVAQTTLHRHQLLLNLAKPEVLKYLQATLEGIFKEYPLDYIKWDYNRDSAEKSLEDAECFRRYRNLYSLLESLQKEHPNLWIETCAGGGGRFDMGMLRYSSRIWASDNQAALDRASIQYGASFFYPGEVVSAHVSHSTTSEENQAKTLIAFLGSFGYELDPAKEPAEHVKWGVELYRKYHFLVENGITYRLSSPTTGAVALAVVEPKSKEIIVIAIALKKGRYSFSLAGVLQGKFVIWDGKKKSALTKPIVWRGEKPQAVLFLHGLLLNK